jgi:hypothetical protein
MSTRRFGLRPILDFDLQHAGSKRRWVTVPDLTSEAETVAWIVGQVSRDCTTG